MNIVIIGNGILGLMSAYQLIRRDSNTKVTLIGPYDNKGCASLAAAAMFNSFAEIDGGTLKNKIETQKFLFNKAATPFWPSLIKELEAAAGMKIEHGFGTFIINNHATDELEDENFDAIVAALQQFNEAYEMVATTAVPKYKPSAQGRASRAMYITGEGWINPRLLFEALFTILRNSPQVTFINNYCVSLHRQGNAVQHVVLDNGDKVSGDQYILCPGAAFSRIIDASNLDIDFLRVFYGVGSSILLYTGKDTLTNCVRTPNRGLACGIYAAPHDSEHTLIGASNYITPEPLDYGRVTSIYTLLKSAMEQLNTDYYRAGLVKSNVGWRPTSADTLPMLGRSSLSNLVIATGTKRDGLHCSPVISDYLADLVLSGSSPWDSTTQFDMALYNPERKLVRIYTREDAIKTAVRHSINAAYQHDFVPAKARMVEMLEKHYRDDLEALHDKVGAHDWGIPPEMIDMYRYGHIK